MTNIEPVNAILLIDKRVFNYQTIADSIRDDVRCILYDVDDRTYDTMVDYIKAKIGELNVTSFTTIGIVEYNTNRNYYRLFGERSPDALVTSVIVTEPELQSWSYIKDFIVWLRTTYAIQHFDFLACSIYINMNWKYIIDTLSTTTGVRIRASTDKTGSSTLGGDWILESTGTDIDMREIYFNNTIENFDGVLDIGVSITNIIPDPFNPNTPTVPSYNGGRGEFLWPRFCKIYNNTLYVADEQNYRVQIFDLSLNYISRISYSLPVTDFALNPTNGRYYFLAHARMNGYSADGTVLFQVSSDLAFPRSITLDSSGNIYVSLGTRIRRFDPLGTPLGDFMNNPGSGNGQIGNATTITFDSSGNFWMTDEGASQSTSNHRVQKFTSTGTFLMTFGSGGTGNGQFRSPYGLAFDTSGNIYVGDFHNDRFQKFNSSGTFLATYGSAGTQNGQLDGPIGIAVDSNNNIYVVENNNQRLQKFNSSGTYVAKAGYLANTNSSATGAFNTPLDVQMFPPNGNFYVVDSGNHRVQKFNSSMVFVLSIGSFGSGNSQFNTPQRLAIDASENFYVSDKNNHVVKVFNSSGTYLRRVGTGTSGSATGQFNSPLGVALDSALNLYVTDNNTRIQKFDSSGTFVASYTIVENAWGLALDTSGNMYVTGGSTVYKYSPSGTILITMTNASPWFVGINVRGISVDPITNNFAIVNQSGSPFLKIYNSSGTRLLATDATTTTSSGGSIGVSVAASGMFYYNNTLFISQEFGALVLKASLQEILLTPSLTTSTFTVPGLKTTRDAPFAITTRPTSNNSGSAITYTSNNTSVATISADGSGNAITIVGTGIVTFTASQAATATYYAASVTSNALTVILAASTFASSTFAVATSKNVGDASFAIITRPTSDSSGAITYVSNNPDVATITPDGSGNAISLVAIGTVTFTATQAATSQYAASTRTSNQLTVSLGTPSLTTFTITNTSKVYGDPSFSILTRPTSNSSGAITYTSNNPAVATIDTSGNWINIVGAGDVSFNALQAAVPNQFTSASRTSDTLTVARGTSTLSASSFQVASSKTILDVSFAISTKPTSNNTSVAIVYSSSNTNVATIDPSGTGITIVGLGDVSFNATQPQTNQYNAATKTSNTLTVTKATTTLAFVNPPTSKNVTDAPFTLVASSASTGAVTYSSNNVSIATVNASTGLVTLKTAGTVTITASQASSAIYQAPANATCSIAIASAGTALQGQTVSSSTSFASVDLSGASLVGTTVAGVSFSGANLRNVNFSGAVITNANFSNTNIKGATNLPEFSTVQKLQLLKNINNVDISAVQVTAPVSGSDINALLATPRSEVAAATFTIKAPATVDASANKVVTVNASDVSGNKSIYIPINANETVKINNTVYSFDGTNLVNPETGSSVLYLSIEGKPFKIYAGSVVALNVQDALNKITINGDGLYNVLYNILVPRTI